MNAGGYFEVQDKRILTNRGGITIFDGRIDDWNFEYPLDLDSRVMFEVADCLAQLGTAILEWKLDT